MIHTAIISIVIPSGSTKTTTNHLHLHLSPRTDPASSETNPPHQGVWCRVRSLRPSNAPGLQDIPGPSMSLLDESRGKNPKERHRESMAKYGMAKSQDVSRRQSETHQNTLFFLIIRWVRPMTHHFAQKPQSGYWRSTHVQERHPVMFEDIFCRVKHHHKITFSGDLPHQMLTFSNISNNISCLKHIPKKLPSALMFNWCSHRLEVP